MVWNRPIWWTSSSSSLFWIHSLQFGYLSLCQIDTSLRRWYHSCWQLSYLSYSLIAPLSTKFTMEDLGPLRFFLGIEISSSNGLYLSQSKYSFYLLRKTTMLEAKSFPSPASTSNPDGQGGEFLWSLILQVQCWYPSIPNMDKAWHCLLSE